MVFLSLNLPGIVNQAVINNNAEHFVIVFAFSGSRDGRVQEASA